MSTREKAEVFLSKSDAFIADLGLSQVPECWASYGARIVRDLLAEIAALRLALDTATRERNEARRHAEEQLADVLHLRFLGIEFASQYGDRALACKYDNSCDDSGREPACIPCAFRYALGLMGVG